MDASYAGMDGKGMNAEGEIRTLEPLRDEALNLTPLTTRQPPLLPTYTPTKRAAAIKKRLLSFTAPFQWSDHAAIRTTGGTGE